MSFSFVGLEALTKLLRNEDEEGKAEPLDGGSLEEVVVVVAAVEVEEVAALVAEHFVYSSVNVDVR